MRSLGFNGYNVFLARTLGIYSSIMLSVIDTSYEHYCNAQKLNADGSFSLSRNYVSERTGLSVDEQIQAERALNSSGILTVKQFRANPDKNYYFYNQKAVATLMNDTNASYTFEIKQNNGVARKKAHHTTQREKHLISLKNSINVENETIRSYLIDWLDAVYANPGKNMTVASLKICIDELNSYSTEQEVQEDILRIAIKNGWCDIKWAIKNYNDAKGKSKLSNNWVSYDEIASDGTEVVKEVF